MSPQDEATARAEIRHVQSTYNNAGDRGRIDELLTTFMPDGVLETPGDRFIGHDAIADFLTSVVTGAIPTDLFGSRHHLATSRIEFEGADSARGWTYFFVMRRGVVIQEGTYLDRFARTEGRWLIAHRRVKVIYDAPS